MRWTAHGFCENINILDDRIRSGSTGFEIVASVAGYFLELKKADTGKYNVAEDLIRCYLDLCKDAGLIFPG